MDSTNESGYDNNYHYYDNYNGSYSDDIPMHFDPDEVSYASYKANGIYNFVVDIIFVLPTIFGNVLILAAICSFRGLRKSTSCVLIGNLAVADLLVGVFVFPLDILIRVKADYFRHPAICLLFFCLIYTAVTASVMNLFLLSLERFHAIVCPLKHAMVFTKRRLYLIILIVWVLTFSIGFLPIFGLHHKVEEETFTCGTDSLLYEEYTKVICSIIVISLTVNGIFFFIIVKVVIKTTSSIKKQSVTLQQQDRLKKTVRHTKMMLIVSGLFIIFWGPFCLISLVPNPSPNVQFIKMWMSTFGLINSAMNWIVYGIRSRKFRYAFKTILMCKCSQGHVDISSIST